MPPTSLGLCDFGGFGSCWGGEACCVLVFVRGDNVNQVAVSLSAEDLCARAIAVQKTFRTMQG